MRIMKHAFLSLIRKPTKAIMIFTILLVVYGLVFTVIIIQNSVKSSKEYVREELGAVVQMKADIKKAMQDKLLQEKYGNKLQLSASLAEELAKDPMVKALYLLSDTVVSSDKLKSAINLSAKSGDSSDSDFETSSTTYVTTTGADTGGEATFQLQGSNEDVPLEFLDGSYKITNGRLRNASDKGKDTLLVSEEFATANNLSVGDKVDLISMADKQVYPFEIIGTYSGSSQFLVDILKTSMESIRKLNAEEGAELNISEVSFLLKNPMQVESFIKKYENRMPNEYIVLYSNDSEYKTLTRPLDLTNTILSILLVIVFIAGVIIMLAIITMFVKDRRFEIGLLLASGEGKIKILSQFIFEILIISILAFGAASGASKFASDYTASWIVNNQLVEDDTKDLSGNAVVNIDIGGSESKKTLKMSDVAKDFNVSVNRTVIRNLLLISLGITVFSAAAPMLIIFGYKPRESLQN